MTKTIRNKENSRENTLQYNDFDKEKRTKIREAARMRFETTKQIKETIHSQPEKNKKNSDLFNEWIEIIINRAYPSNLDTQAEKEISEIDCYYIPDTEDPVIKDLLKDDEKIYEILYGLICRPQFFWKDRATGERIMTQNWLDRLNYILNMAAKHTLRHIDEASLLRTNLSSTNNTPGYWEPLSTKEQNGEARIWYNYFKDKLKDFTVSQRSDKDKKYKIYFNIQSKEQFCQLIKALIVDYVPVISGWSQIWASTYSEDYCKYYYDKTDRKLHKGEVIHPAEEIKLKPISTRIKDWLFLKNISCYADVERCDGYASRWPHVEQIETESLDPLLQSFKPQDVQKHDTPKQKRQTQNTKRHREILANHQIKDYKLFEVNYKDYHVKWKVVVCTKSQNSIIDKTRRDVNYSAPANLNDMIRWSFIMKDHRDVIFMLHYYLKFFIKNPERNFEQNSNLWFDPKNWILRWLEIKDKWILNTEIEQEKKNIDALPKWRTPKNGTEPRDFDDDELNWAATNFILHYRNKSSSRKTTTSAEYTDVKLNVPHLMRPNSLNVEYKFITEDIYNNNEHGLSDHDIYDLAKSNQLQSRDEKFILAAKLKQEINLLLEKRPDLKAEIEAKLTAENRWKDNIDAAEKIYKDITSKLVIIRGKYWENWFEPTLFCDKIIWEHLKNAWFNFSAEWFHYPNN